MGTRGKILGPNSPFVPKSPHSFSRLALDVKISLKYGAR